MSTDLERFLATDGRTDAVQRVRAEIDAKGISYIYYQFVSVTGRIMGKGAPADQWERMAERGFQLVYGSTANLFIDRHGNYIGYGPEASELVGLADVETFCQLPWDPKTARVFCTLFRRWCPWCTPRQRFGTPAAHLSIMRHTCGRSGMGSSSESRSISTPQRRLLPTAWSSPARGTGGSCKAPACASVITPELAVASLATR